VKNVTLSELTNNPKASSGYFTINRLQVTFNTNPSRLRTPDSSFRPRPTPSATPRPPQFNEHCVANASKTPKKHEEQHRRRQTQEHQRGDKEWERETPAEQTRTTRATSKAKRKAQNPSSFSNNDEAARTSQTRAARTARPKRAARDAISCP